MQSISAWKWKLSLTSNIRKCRSLPTHTHSQSPIFGERNAFYGNDQRKRRKEQLQPTDVRVHKYNVLRRRHLYTHNLPTCTSYYTREHHLSLFIWPTFRNIISLSVYSHLPVRPNQSQTAQHNVACNVHAHTPCTQKSMIAMIYPIFCATARNWKEDEMHWNPFDAQNRVQCVELWAWLCVCVRLDVCIAGEVQIMDKAIELFRSMESNERNDANKW